MFDIDVRDFDSTVETVRNWLRTHATVGDLLAQDGAPFFSVNRSVDEGLLAEMAVSSDSRLVAARLMHWEGANRARGLPGDPARQWRTEATIGRDDETAWIAVRTWFTGLDTDRRPCAPPRFVGDLWNAGILSDGVNFGKQVWPVEFVEDIELLAELIEDPQRDFPVVLFAEGAPLDADAFSPRGVGVAHVCRILEVARFPLAQRLGAQFALHRRSVRTYYPLVTEHEMVAPGAAPSTIAGWRFGTIQGPEAFASWLHEDLGRIVTRRMLNDAAHSTYEEVKAAAIQEQRATLVAQNAGAETLVRERDLAIEESELLLAENEELQKTIQYQNELAREYGINDKKQQDDIAQRDAEIASLRGKLATLREQFSARGLLAGDMSDDEIEAIIAENTGQPDVGSAVQVAERILDRVAADVVFSQAAYNDALESPFLRPDDVMGALIRLGFRWKKIRAGNGATLATRVRDTLGLWFAARESAPTMRQYGNERKLRHEGVDLILEKHLTLGGGPQNATTTAQIYFGDNEDGQLLIGHVGRHLTVVNTQ